MQTQPFSAATWTECPYCGTRNAHFVEMVQYPIIDLVTCNIEEGGCDKKYAINVIWKAHIDVMSLQNEYSHEDFYAESKLFADKKEV